MEINTEYPRPYILCQPQILKPMHGLNPRSILGEEWWNEIRQKVYKATDYHCSACGCHKSEAEEHQWLEAHECYEIDCASYTYICNELVALCHYCHNFIHLGRLERLMNSGKITNKKYSNILIHGQRILANNGINKNKYLHELYGNYVKAFQVDNDPELWNKWKLLLENKIYYSKFSNYQEWKNFYNN